VVLRSPTCILKKKRGYLESNRAWQSTHGGRKIYLRERPFEALLRPPLLFPRAFGAAFEREAPPRLAELFLAPPFLAPLFRPPELAAFRTPEDFRPPAFLAPDDFDAARDVFFLAPPLEPALAEPVVEAGRLELVVPDPADAGRAFDVAPKEPLRAAPPDDCPLL
jgi:hypothetical protein